MRVPNLLHIPSGRDAIAAHLRALNLFIAPLDVGWLRDRLIWYGDARNAGGLGRALGLSEALAAIFGYRLWLSIPVRPVSHP